MTDAESVREIAQPLAGEARDYDALLQLIGDARFVLIGEASHGTHEFYFERAAITKRLIAEKGFSIIAVEADWPDSARVHRMSSRHCAEVMKICSTRPACLVFGSIYEAQDRLMCCNSGGSSGRSA